MRTAIPILLLLCAGAALWMAFDPDEAGVGSERETPETEDTQANAPLLEGAKRTPLREETAAPVDTAPVHTRTVRPATSFEATSRVWNPGSP